jgi:hypothetical protein
MVAIYNLHDHHSRRIESQGRHNRDVEDDFYQPAGNRPRSVEGFYAAIGARNEPKFTDSNAAMMVLSDNIYVMLLKHDFYSTFTGKPIADAHQSSQVLLALSVGQSLPRSTPS